MKTPDEAVKILSHMQVPGWPQFYVLGCFENRVTLYSQQVRALNLVWALSEDKKLAAGTKVAVIGGGAAGLAAAAAALYMEAKVTVLERRAELLPVQRGCRHRWLHPHVYDWPAEGSLQRNAGLPLMDWEAGYAHDVVEQIEERWKPWEKKARVILDVDNIDPHVNGTLTWGTTREKFDIIILAVGFGLEQTNILPDATKYWDADNLERSTERKRFLISGCGDGALVDLLRIRVRKFRHHELVKRFVKNADMTALAESLLNIEEKAKSEGRGGQSPSDVVYEAYQDLEVPSAIDEAFQLRTDTTAILCTRDNNPFKLKASILHRLLVSRLLKLPNSQVNLRQRELREGDVERVGGRFRVQFDNGQPEMFDSVTIRHGTTPALQNFFGIWSRRADLLARNALDETRKRHWPSGTFGPEPPCEYDDEPPAPGSASNVPGAPQLTDYLHRLQENTGRVRLAGDTQYRSIESVFVELEITRTSTLDRGGEQLDNTEPGASEFDPELSVELTQRQRAAPWARSSNSETISADSLIDLADRILIVGAAGTGKSTLLRWLAFTAAKARVEAPTARVPLWLPRVPDYHVLAKGQLADKLARLALDAVGFDDRPSEARTALTGAIASGQCVLFIDSLDEAGAEDQEHLDLWLSEIGGRVVLASRPKLARDAWQNVVHVRLHGIPKIAAEQMLHSYFPDEAFVHKLIATLDKLPDGRTWLETPMLLGLAATLFRTRPEALPTSTLELYKLAVDQLLQYPTLPERYRGDFFRPRLQTFARAHLLPESGSLRVTFDADELPAPHDTLLKSGLFEGTSIVRFAHLGLGERLAAEADIDLPRARAALAQARPRDVEALEVLPMAHAIQAPEALDGALADARLHDHVDHRLLRLLLRSIGFGGRGVNQFCQEHGSEVLQLVADRMQTPSGRFGEAERELMDAAERAFPVLGPHVPKQAAERSLSPLLATRGDVAAEAHTVTWALDMRSPDRVIARWWMTIYRQARAIVQRCPDIDAIRRVTSGSDLPAIKHTVSVLGRYPDYWPAIRPFLEHYNAPIREAAMIALKDDPAAQPALIERLTDDEAGNRARAVYLLGAASEHRGSLRQRLCWALEHDQSTRVKIAALSVLAGDPMALPAIRSTFKDTFIDPLTHNSVILRREAMRALANDEASAEQIRELLAQAKLDDTFNDAILQDLARTPAWRELLLRRLTAPDVSPSEVTAMASDLAARESIANLLRHGSAAVKAAAIRALMPLNLAEQSTVVELMEHEPFEVRKAAFDALGASPEHTATLLPFLESEHSKERSSVRNALSKNPEIDVNALQILQEDSQTNVDFTSINALAGHSRGRAALRNYFLATRSKPAWELISGGHSLHHRWTRAHILRALGAEAEEPDQLLIRYALEDPHPDVRKEAIAHAPPDPSLRSKRYALLDDPDTQVRFEALRMLSGDIDVRQRLAAMLDEDNMALRLSAFSGLVDHASARDRLRALLSSPNASSAERLDIIRSLLRDPGSHEAIRHCIKDRDSLIRRAALTLMQHDAEIRLVLRESARDPEELTDLSLEIREIVLKILAGDAEAYPILREHLTSEDPNLLEIVAWMLAEDPLAGPKLRLLLEHPDEAVRFAALCGLVRDEAARLQLVEHLKSRKSSRRQEAAEALRDVAEAHPHFVPLLRDDSYSVRRIALDVLKNDDSSAVKDALRERLIEEPKDDLRLQILDALAKDCDAEPLLRERLHHDPDSDVRRAAARSLRNSALPPATDLTALPAIRRVLSLFGSAPGSAADDELLARLRVLIERPAQCDLDADPDLGVLAFAWACVRLVWASVDGGTENGRGFGEVDGMTRDFGGPGDLVIIRVAMDVADLPRERFLHPNHNLLMAWEFARHLHASVPPGIVLACADVSFEHLVPPPLAPGELCCGPTFFGFRLHATPSPTVDFSIDGDDS